MNYKLSYLISKYSHQHTSLANASEVMGLSSLETRKQVVQADKMGMLDFDDNQKQIFVNKVSPRKWASAMIGHDDNYPFYSEKERQAIIYLFCYQGKYLMSVYFFQSTLSVSKGTVISDIKHLRHVLEQDNLSLDYTRKDGYVISGSELIIRRVAKNFVSKLLQTNSGRFALYYWLANSNLAIYAETRDYILEAIKKYNLTIVPGRIDDITFFIAGSLLRIEHNKLSIIDDMEMIKSLKAYKAGEMIIQKLIKKSNSKSYEIEKCYVTVILMTVIQGELRDYKLDVFLNCSANIINNMEKLMAIEFDDYKDLLINLFYHLVPAYFRIKFDFYLPNLLIDNIKQQYIDIYHFTKRALSPLLQILDKKTIPDEEIGLFTILFGGAIANEQIRSPNNRLKAVIVCPNGTSSSLILQSELKKIFPEIDFDSKGTINNLQNIPEEQYDLIFTTVPIDNMPLKKTFVVSPLMTELEKNQLITKVQRKVLMPGFKLPSAKTIINALNPLINLKSGVNEEDLYKVINRKINRNYKLREDNRPMLTDLINEDMIQVTYKKLDWQQAIEMVAQPLLDHDIIETRYINAMIDKVKHYGPFIHIGKGIALPHARPEEGTKNIGMSVLKVEKPVLLLNKPEHKISIFICLAAIDNTTHLKALSSLTTILSDENNLNDLLKANTKKDILTILSKEVN